MKKPKIVVKKFKTYKAYKAGQMGSCIWTRKYPVYMQRCRDAVKKFKKNWIRGCKVLDAGCGDGFAMDVMRKYGYIPFGADFQPAKVRVAEEAGHVTKCCDLHNLPYGFDFFDVVYHRHTFEHLIKPLETLKEFYRVLKPGGRLDLIVPIEGIRSKHVHAIPGRKYMHEMFLSAGFINLWAEVVDCKAYKEVWISGIK